MRVLKRSGSFENVSFDKILNRIDSLCNDQNLKNLNIDSTIVAQKVCSEIYDEVKTSDLDILSSQIAISLYSTNLEFKELASRIVISNHHKNTKNKFSTVIEELYNYKLVSLGASYKRQCAELSRCCRRDFCKSLTIKCGGTFFE